MYVPTEGPKSAKIFLVGEAPGKEEDILGKPFIGAAGRTLNWLLSQAGINRPECLVGNVARERPLGNKISYWFEDKKCTQPKVKLTGWINQLKEEIEASDARVIVALGATALWALTGEKRISTFRGYVLDCTLVPGKKVIPTYHPQAVNYEWKLHFPTILDLRKARYHSEFYDKTLDDTITVPNAHLSEFISYCKMLLDNPEIEIVTTDVETVQPGSHISMIGLSHTPSFAISVRILDGKAPALPENDEKELWYWLGKVFSEKKVIIQNASYDIAVILMNQGILIKNLWMDTLLAAHCCFPEMPRDLGFLASLLLDVPPWKHTSEENKSLYNALDCARTHGIALALHKEMQKQSVLETFNFEMSELEPAIMLQLQGIYADEKKKEELLSECNRVIEETKVGLKNILGREVNYNSPKQLQQLLYVDLGLPVQFKRRKSKDDTKKISADSEAIKKLARLVPDNPIFNLILLHKKYLKLKTSFVDIELSPRSTVHTSYNITGSATDDEGRKSFGRWSSSKSIIIPFGSGNLQNIPAQARVIYTAPEGYEYIQADYVQAEAVCVSYIINDGKAKNLFVKRRSLPYSEKGAYDIHKLTASQMFGIPLEEVTKELRRIGKTLRHAGNYDAGPAAIATTLGCNLNDAKSLKELYHRATPQLRLWYQRIQEKLRRDRTLTNQFGRIHKFMGRLDDSTFRSAYAYDPQSTVGDLLNRALVRFYNLYCSEIPLILQLHDAVYVLSELGKRKETVEKLLDAMIMPMTVNHERMVIEVDFKYGPSWGEQFEFDHEELVGTDFVQKLYNERNEVN